MSRHRRWSRAAALLVGALLALAALPAPARREMLTQEQKAHLQHAERVRVEAIALTDQGGTDPTELERVIARRLGEMGFAIVTDAGQPSDVTLKVKCEERKVWEGTARSGGDADVPGSASRVWRGPACQLTYALEGVRIGWRREVRADFEDPQAAARAAGASDPGAFALAQLRGKLEQDEFPLVLAAEWGQGQRLLAVLDEPAATPARKTTAIALLGNMSAAEAVPRLVRALKDPDRATARAAAVALGTIGDPRAVTPLLELFRSDDPESRAAAARGLGLIAAVHPEADIVPALLASLDRGPIRVQIEIVRALGRTPDRRMLEPLRRLDRSVQAKRGAAVTPDVVELKKTLGMVLDQFDGIHSYE